MKKENKPADTSAKKTKNIANLKDQKVEGKQVKGGAINTTLGGTSKTGTVG